MKMHLIKKLYKNLRYFYLGRFFTIEEVIRKRFKWTVKRNVDLKNPQLFSEKLQWLKLNWDNPIAKKCADKYEVRKIVEDIIGSEYLNDLYGVYDSVDEINLEKLPNSFVLKATHGSDSNIICRDKKEKNWNKEYRKMKKWFNRNIYWITGEWVYKDIKPRIISERYLENENSKELYDYKFYCFNGTPMYCQVIKERNTGSTIDFFDTEWNHMEFTGLKKRPQSKYKIKKPQKYNEMLELAKKLSNSFPFVRVDFYYVNNKIYFGELTFFPKSGFGEFNPPEWNEKLGNLIELPEKNLS